MIHSASTHPKWYSAFILTWILIGAGFAHAELHITKSLWGFDGNVLPGRQALLTVEVENRGTQEFSGEIVLRAGRGELSQSGVAHSNEVYLSPGQRRWIQFHPYIKNNYSKYELTWGRDGEFDLGKPDFGPPATVLLAEVDGLGTLGSRMRIFPENAFPASIAAMAQLHAVVLDHVPRWDAARRTAFLDWIKSGGIVHLALGMDGKRPEFPGELAVLNQSEKVGRIGLGLVVSHNLPRQEITEQTLASAGYASPVLVTKEGQPHYYYQDINQTLLEKLTLLTRADIAWHLIFVLTLFYITIIGPVYFMFRKRDYRFLLTLFLGTVVIFSAMFMFIGRRGYGESQVTHTLTVAKVLEPGRCNITQWTNAFATKGGLYAFQHQSQSGFYGSVDQQSVPGKVLEGKDGALLADIPLFSSQPFIFQGVMKCSTPDVRLSKQRDIGGGSTEFELTIPIDPSEAGQTHVMIRYIDQFCELKQDVDGLWKKSAPYKDADSIMAYDKWQHFDMWNSRRTDKLQAQQTIIDMWPALMACAENRDLFYDQGRTFQHKSLPNDVLRVYVYTKSPGDLNPAAKGFASATGYVLYVTDLTVPKS